MDPETVVEFVSSLTLNKLVPALVILVAGYFIIKALVKLFDNIIARSKVDKSLHTVLHSTMQILLNALLIIIVAGTLGINVSSLVAVLSVASLAISLAVQGTLSNFAGGIQVLSAHPFSVGDYVEIGSEQGTVSEIGLVYTKLTTADNKVVFVPNSTVSTSIVTNYNCLGKRRIDLKFKVSYDCPIEDVKAVLTEAARMVPTMFETPAVSVRVTNYLDSSIEYQIRGWTASETYWDSYYDIIENVKKNFDEHNISMTYPHMNVHIRQQ